MNEDNFFFALVITLVVLVYQVPDFDISYQFFHWFGVTLNLQPYYLVNTKTLFFILLFISSVFRYCTVFTEDHKLKTLLRVFSAMSLFFIPYFFVLDLPIRGLGALILTSNVFLIIITPLIQIGITIAIGVLLEKRLYRYYGHNGRLLFGYVLFTFVGLIFLFTYYIGIVIALYFGVSTGALPLFAISVPLSILTIYASYVVDSRIKKERQKTDDGKSWDKFIKKLQSKYSRK